MATQRKEVLVDSVYSVIALLCILVACAELCGASAVVDVYRLIQYDLAGVPFGSRLASLNHHAGSSLFAPGADLSRTVVMLPVRELNVTFIRGKLDFDALGYMNWFGNIAFVLKFSMPISLVFCVYWIL
ncbi:hypothetical protein RJ639_010301 [Escallonia herrerae]|uniref:Uncharacterized protein n=1 Tax=Escallonia herrerae TaxID=1293975 RepID=A0AA88VSN1_9ASTE|nr:hypothetical protein RJ639_010301 [Escallonia herrerae]